MLIPGQPCIVVWHHVNNLRPVFLSKNHVQTARGSHDSNVVLVVWKRLLVDLTIGITHALTFAGSRWSCLNAKPQAEFSNVFRGTRQMLMHWNKHVGSLFLHFIWFHENSRRRRLTKHKKIALTALHTFEDAILFFRCFWRQSARNAVTMTSTKIKTKSLFWGSLALSFDVT